MTTSFVLSIQDGISPANADLRTTSSDNSGSAVARAGAAVAASHVIRPAITGGATAKLNGAGDGELLVRLDAATHLNTGTAAFIKAAATAHTGAPVVQQTLASTQERTAMAGYFDGLDIFQGSKNGLSGDRITNFIASDKMHLIDLLPSSPVFAIPIMRQQLVFLGSGDWLTVAGSTVLSQHMHMAADWHGGSLITFA